MQPSLRVAEPWQEASVEIKTHRSWAPTVASGKGHAGAWYQGKKRQLQRPKSSHKKKEALGVAGGKTGCLYHVAKLCSSAWG